MYAIVESGSKQIRVQEGDFIHVDLLEQADKNVVFDKVLLFNDGTTTKTGLPHIKNCIVKGEVVEEQVLGPKVISYKYKKRKSYHKKKGHRQQYTKVKITQIQAG